jgi:tRNA U34 5-methylaminomethyl-2-thiouridine-forming methyltransferase MnmC
MDFSRYFCNHLKILVLITIAGMTLPELAKTDDGSDTLFVRELGEHYHSTFGAVQESTHVFIEAGLKKCDKPKINIFEVGFGTGLNAFLTLLETVNTDLTVRYFTVEKYPLPVEIWSNLNYTAVVPRGETELYGLIHNAKWNREVKITDRFSICKLSSDFIALDYSELPLFDLIYFDAFSPEKQPELWETTIFRKLSDHCVSGGKIVTYCAKGVVRRSLMEVGFTVERIPGPPGKREMLRGTKNGFTSLPYR